MLTTALALALLLFPPVEGLDHVPVAVRDLEAAGDTYRRLGFVLKPGRPHDNGIRNLHAKFPDGTELELITAPRATDDLTARYRTHLEAGDGPAFLALFAPMGSPSVDAVPGIFFGPRNHSPTDRPEHFAHPNTARSLIAVWLAGELAAERRLLEAVGATFSRREVAVPEPVTAAVARLGEGEVILLPERRRIVPGRPIVGVTLRVASRAAAKRVLEAAAVPLRETPRALFIAPSAAHGLWIELRE